MSIMDSGEFSAVFEDVHSPLFTQREAAELSGVDQKAISNWLDRKFIILEPVNGRPQVGRRLFSREQVLTLKFVACLIRTGVAVSDAFAMAKRAYIETKRAFESNALGKPFRDRPTEYSIWMIFTRGSQESQDEADSQPIWQYDVVISVRWGMMFWNLDGTTFNSAQALEGNAPICLPVGNLAGMLNGQIHLLLAADLDPSLP